MLTELDLDDLREIYRARQLLEDEAARAALPRLTAEDLARMRALCDEMERLGTDDAAAMAVVNRRFHFVLLEASRMPHLLHHIRLLWNTSDHYRSEYSSTTRTGARCTRSIGGVVEAAAARDADALIAALDEHRDHAIEGLRTTLEETHDA